MKIEIEVDTVGEMVELFDIFKNHFFAKEPSGTASVQCKNKQCTYWNL